MENQSKFFNFCVPFIICLEMINFDFKMIYLISTKTVYYGNVGMYTYVLPITQV